MKEKKKKQNAADHKKSSKQQQPPPEPVLKNGDIADKPEPITAAPVEVVQPVSNGAPAPPLPVKEKKKKKHDGGSGLNGTLETIQPIKKNINVLINSSR